MALTPSSVKRSTDTTGDDLDEHGTWTLQVYIEMPTGKWHSDVQRFTVHDNLN